jgi:exonuclease SbcD
MQRVDFSEEADRKGFFVVELDPSRPRGERYRRHEFYEVPARRFVTVEAAPAHEDPTPEVLRAIERRPIADAVVRVQLKLSRAQLALLDERAVREALAPAYTVAAIAKEVLGEARPRLGDVSVAQLTPLQVLEHYLDIARASLKSDPRVVLEYGRRLLAEVEHME